MTDYDYDQAAKELNIKPSFLKHAVGEMNLPHIKYSLAESGKGAANVRFTDADLDAIRAIFRKNASTPALQPTGRRRS